MENQTEQSALQAGEKATASNSLSTKGQGSATTTPPQEARLPYVAPTIEVIEVKTERGYAGSASNERWSPATW